MEDSKPLMSGQPSRRVIGALGLAALLSACSTSPLGRNQLAFYSDDELAQMGEQSFAQYEQELPTVSGAQATYVQCVAKAITAEKPLPLFAGDMDGEGIIEPPPQLPGMSEGEQVVEDYVAMRLTLRKHPVALLRHLLTPDRTGAVNTTAAAG